MATPIWLSTANGDWNTDANWSTGSKPANGDTAIIDGPVTVDGFDASGVNLAALIRRETHTGHFGTSAGNPLKVAVAGECSIRGGIGTNVYLNSGASNPIVNLLVELGSPTDIFDIGGTVTYGECNRGKVTSAASFTHLSLEPLGGNPLNLPQPIFNGGTITLADLTDVDAEVLTATTFTTANIINARLKNLAGTFTTLNCIGRLTTFLHYHTATMTTLNIKAGAFFNGAVDRRTKTITNVILHRGGRIAAGNITLTNGIKRPSRLAASDYADAAGIGPPDSF